MADIRFLSPGKWRVQHNLSNDSDFFYIQNRECGRIERGKAREIGENEREAQNEKKSGEKGKKKILQNEKGAGKKKERRKKSAR